MSFEFVTTTVKKDIYLATNDIFHGLIKEVRELSKKKPEATMSASKVKIINRALVDLNEVLSSEPQAKFLDLLDDELMPQTSDAVLIMVQYEIALRAFLNRYERHVSRYGMRWITEEFVAEYEVAYVEEEDEEEEDYFS